MEEKGKTVDIPQIKPEEAVSDPGESILVPKIETPVAQSKVPVPNNKLPSRFKLSFTPKTKKILVGVGVGILAILILVIIPGLLVFSKGKALYKQTQTLMGAAKSQDIPVIKAEIGKTKTSLASTRRA